MASKFIEISANNNLLYYYNTENIPNQKLVAEIVNYFDTGEGARVFSSLELLNLLWKQYNFIVENISNTDQIFDTIINLPLNPLERHVLFGLIIKWFGGYPLDAPSGTANSQVYYLFKKKLLEVFLSYPEETPEKEFCKRNFEKKKHLIKLGCILTASINNNIDATTLINLLEKQELPKINYSTFEELFNSEAAKGTFGVFKNEIEFSIKQTQYNFEFNLWLQENKNWEYGNTAQYHFFLNDKIFNEFKNYLITVQNIEDFVCQYNEDSFRVFQNNYQQLRGKFRVKRKATAEDERRFLNLKEGDILSYEPEYRNTAEAFTYLTKYYAAVYLELEKYLFTEKYKIWNEASIDTEIIELEAFIKKAQNLSFSAACEAFNHHNGDRDEFIYLRLKNGFYENLEIEKYPLINAIGNIEAKIYGRYFLFYSFLLTLQDKDQMAEKFSLKKLHEYGFKKNQIERLMKSENEDEVSFKNNKCYFASKKEDKIYHGIVAARKYFLKNTEQPYFPFTDPDLIPEYYDLKLNMYVEKERKSAGPIFIEKEVRNEFKQNELLFAQKKLNEFEQLPKFTKTFELRINIYKRYIEWLNNNGDIMQPQETETESVKLKIDQIALIHVYKGYQITRENGNEIARQYKYSSGEKLFQRFTYFSSPANRKGRPVPCTLRKLKNKIELFESIVTHLSDRAKQRANDEINILKTIFEHEYQ